MPVTHAFTNPKADGADTTVVRPSDWNAGHTITADSSFPGYVFDYTEKTSSTSVTNTIASSADTVITAGAVTYDGSTRIEVEFYAVAMQPGTTNLSLNLWDGSTDLGRIAYAQLSNSLFVPVRATRVLTPSNASHTYSVRGYVDAGTGTVPAGAGGAGATNMPCFIRQRRA